MQQPFALIDWTFGFADMGTHSGNYLDKFNTLISEVNNSTSAYNAQLYAATDSASVKEEVLALRDESLVYRDQAFAVSVGDITGTAVDFSALSVGGVHVALDDNTFVAQAAYYLDMAEKLDKTGDASNSLLLKGINADFYMGLSATSSSANPDNATTQVMVTNHGNSPSALYYWHITTTFYNTRTSTASRSQLAVQYNGGTQLWARSCYSNNWRSWVRCDNKDIYASISGLWSALAGKLGSGDKSADSFKLGGKVGSTIQTASTVAIRDANGNIKANGIICIGNGATNTIPSGCELAVRTNPGAPLVFHGKALLKKFLGVEDKIIHGSNANGYYVKYPNGTLVCSNRIMTDSANLYKHQLFAFKFKTTSNIRIVCSGQHNSGHIMGASVMSVTACYLSARRASDNLITNAVLNYFAIGTWK